MTRLLIVDHAADDFARSRLELARQARAAGFEVEVALPDAAQPAPGFATHGFHLARVSTSPRDELRTLATLTQLYRRIRPQLVHHFGVKPALYGGLAARLTGIGAAVSTFTGLGYLFRTGERTAKRAVARGIAIGGMRRALGAASHHVVCQIEEDRRALLALRIGAPERMHLIDGLGVDLEQFRPAPEPVGVPIVLMASRLLADKGVHDFVFASQTLRHRGVRARFVLLGDADPGHPSAIPTATLEGWRAQGAIEWHGWQRDMPGWLAASHVVCLPTAYGEGIPRVLMEAAASGRAIVASDLPGCRKVVGRDETGLLVAPGSRERLADAVATLIADPARRARMGAAGRDRAVHCFDRQHVAARYLALYATCLA